MFIWSPSILIFIFLFFIFCSYLQIEEEVLILFASFLWLDAAASFIRKALWELLEESKYLLERNFKNLLKQKVAVLRSLIFLHNKRLNLVSEFFSLYFYYSKLLLSVVINKSLLYFYLSSLYNRKVSITNNLGSLLRHYLSYINLTTL